MSELSAATSPSPNDVSVGSKGLLNKTTADVFAILIGVITLASFGFALWAAFRTFHTEAKYDRQNKAFATASAEFRRAVEEQTRRIEVAVENVNERIVRFEQTFSGRMRSASSPLEDTL